jgi:hypothetical protein
MFRSGKLETEHIVLATAECLQTALAAPRGKLTRVDARADFNEYSTLRIITRHELQQQDGIARLVAYS